jgi:hypothetical protein
MVYKFTTLLQWFELEGGFVADSIWIEWYCYNPDTATLNGFDFKQVPQLETYMKATPNFAGVVSYQPVYVEDIPDFIEDTESAVPAFLIVRPEQKTSIDILLCREDGWVQHDYKLEFSIIGKVLGLAK